VSQGLLKATQGLNPPRVRVTGNLDLVQSNHNLFAPKFHNIIDKAVQPDDIIQEASMTIRHIIHALRFELIDKRHQSQTLSWPVAEIAVLDCLACRLSHGIA